MALGALQSVVGNLSRCEDDDWNRHHGPEDHVGREGLFFDHGGATAVRSNWTMRRDASCGSRSSMQTFEAGTFHPPADARGIAPSPDGCARQLSFVLTFETGQGGRAMNTRAFKLRRSRQNEWTLADEAAGGIDYVHDADGDHYRPWLLVDGVRRDVGEPLAQLAMAARAVSDALASK
jgi:hypothetical protein